MAVNRYDNPAQAQFINTYVPIPFEQLYTLGKEAKAEVDKAYDAYTSALDKWGEFQSPSEVDTKAFYDETYGRALPVAEEMAKNIDLIKTPEGRAKIFSVINNTDRAKLSMLKQSAANLRARQEINAKLMMEGKYNPLWHDVDFTNYNTQSSGIYNDLAPLAYKDIRELSDPYYSKLQKGYLYTQGRYDYFGNTMEDLEGVANAHLNDIANTPEAKMHMQKYMESTGANAQQALEWLKQSVIDSNIDRTIRPTREVNRFALEDYQAKRALELAKAKQKAGKESTTPTLFSTKLAASMMFKPETTVDSNGNKVEYQSQLERVRNTFDPNSVWRNMYVNRVDENGAKLPTSRTESAMNIWNELSEDIGSNAQFINNASLDPNTMIKGFAGNNIYSADNMPGFMTTEQFINAKMGVGVNDTDWNDFRVKLEKDIISGNISGVGITPTNKVVIENGIPGNESFVQEYKMYVPVSYIVENNPDTFEYRSWYTLGFKAADYDADDEDILKDDNFKALVKSLGGRIPNGNGRIADVSSVRIDEDGTFSAGHETQYNGLYIEIPVVRNVLSNSQTRERANQLEFQESNIGTSNNVIFRTGNEELIYGGY